MEKKSRNLKYEDNWVTSMGAWFPGERVVLRGKDLFSEFENFTWMQFLLFAITGREFNEKQGKLFEGIWRISASFPEPRIWNNRISSLAATSRSTGNLAIAASIAVSEAQNYGQVPLIKICDFLIDCKCQLSAGENLEDIIKNEVKKQRWLAGFGRPIVNKDERIDPLIKFATNLGFYTGEHLQLLLKIERILRETRYRFKMNIAAVDAALATDQGLNAREFYHFMTLCFSGGFFPCYIDANQKPEGAFFPLRCERISYEGELSREW